MLFQIPASIASPHSLAWAMARCEFRARPAQVQPRLGRLTRLTGFWTPCLVARQRNSGTGALCTNCCPDCCLWCRWDTLSIQQCSSRLAHTPNPAMRGPSLFAQQVGQILIAARKHAVRATHEGPSVQAQHLALHRSHTPSCNPAGIPQHRHRLYAAGECACLLSMNGLVLHQHHSHERNRQTIQLIYRGLHDQTRALGCWSGQAALCPKECL